MNFPEPARPPESPAREGPDLVRLALILSFSGTGIDQFLRIPPAELLAQPVTQAERWVTGSLMMLPLFAAAAWAAGRLAGGAGAGVTRRALAGSLLAAVAVMPVWFEVNRADGLARLQALVTPGSHGSDDVYWVSSAVICALLLVCLAPAAFWAARGIGGRIRLPGGAGTAARGAVAVAFLAAVPAAAWLLNHAAQHAYASQVSYAGAAFSVRAHSPAIDSAAPFPGGPAGPAVAAAPFAFAYQAAHALQDGLAGQAAGFPVTAVSLWWAARRPSGRDQYQQAAT